MELPLAGRSAVVITASDRCFAGTQTDLSGPAVAGILQDAGAEVLGIVIVPDELNQLMAALREADSGRDGALPKVRDAVQDYRDFLDAAPIVDLIEDNPFGVSVPLRKMLGAALAELERLAG